MKRKQRREKKQIRRRKSNEEKKEKKIWICVVIIFDWRNTYYTGFDGRLKFFTIFNAICITSKR